MNAITIIPFPVKYDSYSPSQSEFDYPDHGDDGIACEMGARYFDNLLTEALKEATRADKLFQFVADNSDLDEHLKVRLLTVAAERVDICARHLRDAIEEAGERDINAVEDTIKECEGIIGAKLDDHLLVELSGDDEPTAADLPCF